MIRFPFKLLFLSIFLPPVLYILTLQTLESYFQKRETAKVDRLIIQNYEALFEGLYPVSEEIRRNIGAYLSHSLKYKLGVRTQIIVKTRDDRIIYPTRIRALPGDSSGVDDDSRLPGPSPTNVEIAAKNYKILNDGLIISVDVRVKRNTWLANGILVFYIFLFLFMIRRLVMNRVRETEDEERALKQTIQDLTHELGLAESRLAEVAVNEENYRKKIAHLNKDNKDLSKDVEGLLEEMEHLEAGLVDQKRIKDETESEVLRLTEALDRLQGKLEEPKKKKKKHDAAARRFKVLYKNLVFTDRAVTGFLSLNEDFQLKAEEVIHKLNEADAQVPVKRKVFGKGGKMNVMEVIFSYSGRIYFQKDTTAVLTILAIGTKNSQQKDLAFIESANRMLQ